MPRGLPSSYIRQAQRELGAGASWRDVFKRAWQIYKGGKVYKAVTPKKRLLKVKSLPRRRRYYPRLRRYRRRRFKLPLGLTIGALGMAATPNPSGRSLFQDIANGDWNNLAYDARERFLCIDNTGAFRFDWLLPHWAPLIIGYAFSKIADVLGINRKLTRVPFVKL